jgi:hypothetical protein
MYAGFGRTRSDKSSGSGDEREKYGSSENDAKNAVRIISKYVGGNREEKERKGHSVARIS